VRPGWHGGGVRWGGGWGPGWGSRPGWGADWRWRRGWGPGWGSASHSAHSRPLRISAHSVLTIVRSSVGKSGMDLDLASYG
jgi:hypothetical protein